MRTVANLKANQNEIRNAMRTIEKQIELLDKEYQQNAVECVGKRSKDWDAMITQLEAAKSTLNTLWHMEIDAEEYAND